MRPIQLNLDIADESLTGFVSNVTGATWTLTNTETTDGLAHIVSIKNDDAVDHSGKTAILTGTDVNDNELIETVTLPGASLTVESTEYFKTLTSIVPSATIGANTMDIGLSDEIMSPWIVCDWRGASSALLQITVTGTISYTVEDTAESVEDYQTLAPNWSDIDDTDLVAATTSQKTRYASIPRAIRVKVNSYSSGAELDIALVHTME